MARKTGRPSRLLLVVGVTAEKIDLPKVLEKWDTEILETATRATLNSGFLELKFADRPTTLM